MADSRIRLRRPEDLPALVALLAEQQSESSYPVRWPLPFPVEDFLVRPSELRSWVAQVDHQVVGHVSVVGVDDELLPAFEQATGATGHDMVSVLFTGAGARGLGLGGALLDAAVAWIRGRSRVPVLDVLPVHDRAVEVYRSRGWAEVGRTRFAWQAPDSPDVLLMALPPYGRGGGGT